MAFVEEVSTLRKTFDSGQTKAISFRKQQLKNLLRLYEENVPAMTQALHTDLRKHKQEAIISEINLLVQEVKLTLKNLKKWIKPERPERALLSLLDKVTIVNDPYGVVLIVGTWNYPVQLTLMPLAGAIAAGNCVVVKPSENAPATAGLMAELLPKYMDANFCKVVQGGPREMEGLLQNRFDYIFFTGSPKIGRIIHAAANKYLTPVTLELGGKSPVILDKSANMDVSARRILWGKCLNAGQTCVAPDYILCERAVGESFIHAAKDILREWYGDDDQSSPDYCRIINDNHFQRLSKLLDRGKVVLGGKTDEADKFIQLTILADVKPTDPVMADEIFGPILPLMYVDDWNQAISYINTHEKPLSLYIFSENKKLTDFILNSTSAGGVCINDTVLHLAVETLPFGGVGNSGMGSYHGKYTFDTFTHRKSVLARSLGALSEVLGSPRYPPYSEDKLKTLSRLYSTSLPSLGNSVYTLLVFALGVVSVLVVEYIIAFVE